jgi:hypothetical protein
MQLEEHSAIKSVRDTSNNDFVLHQLPPEIIYEVADHLASEDIIPFILSCHRHATMLARSPHSKKITPLDMKELKVRLYRDEASQEPYGTSELDDFPNSLTNAAGIGFQIITRCIRL